MRLLFVCLGNICRSPSAEAAMRHLLAAEGLADAVEIDSAGTGSWHVGNPPDERSAAAALARAHRRRDRPAARRGPDVGGLHRRGGSRRGARVDAAGRLHVLVNSMCLLSADESRKACIASKT